MKSKIILINFAAMIMYLILITPVSFGQNLTNCDTLMLSTVGDTASISIDHEKFVVRIDRQPLSRDVICIDVVNPGFYRIDAHQLHSLNQGNESFYLQFRDGEGNFAALINPNYGDYYLVIDDSYEKMEELNDSGIFYLKKGKYILVLNHFILQQDQYPELLNPPFTPMKVENFESVHIDKFIFTYSHQNNDWYNLGIDKKADRDSVRVGESVNYELTVENFGPNDAFEITIIDTLPIHFEPGGYNIEPISYEDHILTWEVERLNAGETISITYSAMLVDTLIKPFITLKNVVLVATRNDTLGDDDGDFNEVVAIDPRYDEMTYDLHLTKTSDKDSVEVGDAVSYELIIENYGPHSAFDVTVADTLPPYFLVTGTSIAPTRVEDNVLVWEFAELAAGQTVRIKVNG
ncbi:DUF11 domain-containing protein, partial [candidate division KSB1 bacterium]|nr:DUF11 domain-containing protein [candidate division KSB1 bacterium]